MKKLSVVILAGGKSKRMKASTPKVLYKICGKTLIEYVLDNVAPLLPSKIIVVVGYKGEDVKKCLSKSKYCDKLQFVEQKEQLGTAHAVLQTKKILHSFDGNVLIIYGDMPLVSYKTLNLLILSHKKTKAYASILTCNVDGLRGYGKVVRDSAGNVVKIVEEKDATDIEKNIKEINVGVYIISAKNLFKHLKRIDNNNIQKEYYLTDIVYSISSSGEKVHGVILQDSNEIFGVNTQEDAVIVSQILKRNILKKLMENGVSFVDTTSVFIDSDVQIGEDTIIYPFTIIEGKTNIGTSNILGPETFIANSTIGNNNFITYSYLEECKIGNNCRIGPYSRIRPETIISDNAKIGNFTEIKKSKIGSYTQINHLSYIGDAEIGENTNIGAGTITCNYDGVKKYPTYIGNNCFVGSDSILVAPVRIGNFAWTAAGSVITKDVPSFALGVGREKQINIENWVRRKNRARNGK